MEYNPEKTVGGRKTKLGADVLRRLYTLSGQTYCGKREGTEYDVNPRGLPLHAVSHLRTFKGTVNHPSYKFDKLGKISVCGNTNYQITIEDMKP